MASRSVAYSWTSWLLLLNALVAVSCDLGLPGADGSPSHLTGTWHATLDSPGGDLPFFLVVSEDPTSASGLGAIAMNGAEQAPTSSVSIEGDRIRLAFEFYDSAITAQLDSRSEHMAGEWVKVVPEGLSKLPFRARRVETGTLPSRFALPDEPGQPLDFGGGWNVRFTDDSGTEPARGEFRQNGNLVTGTFLTATGDYRFLEGNAFGNQLRLSTFDGGHAFLFHATMTSAGTLAGDFWSRDTYHAAWTAEPARPGERVLPDAWSLAGLTNQEGRFGFSFPDLQGRTVSLDQPRFAGKVVLINIFGSWCPNCNDKAPLLANWDRRFRDRGLEIVGLAYEFTGERERDTRQVRLYAERHGIEFPLLLAGVSDKAQAGESLVDLTSVIAYPTSVFIGRDGTVRRIHTGFAGPGTGDHYQKLVAEFEFLLEELLEENRS